MKSKYTNCISVIGQAVVLCAAVFVGAIAGATPVYEVYGTAPDGTVLHWNAYTPAGHGPWPAVLVIHGGGWHSGGPNEPDVEACAQDLANAGFLALAITYRLDEHPLPGQTSDGGIPEQTDDCKMAVRAARARSDCNGRVVAVGGSAGGAHAAYLAVTGVAGDDRVDASVCLSGAMDFSDWSPDPNIAAFENDIEMYCRVPAITPPSQQSIATMRSASPAWQPLSPSTTAPIFLVASQYDPMPHTQLPDMVSALQANHIPVTAYPTLSLYQQLIIPGDLHEFSYWDNPDATVENASIDFLNRALAQEGSPTPTPFPSPGVSQLLNISTRVDVQTGPGVMIGGFIVTGENAKKVLVRGLGPSLAADGTALADPFLQLFDSSDSLIAANDNWKDSQRAEIEATGIPPKNDLESALIATLDPGKYTAVISGKNGGVGLGLVEIYDLTARSGSYLGNISTRGLVGKGPDLLISGFILGSQAASDTVLVRALGPSLVSRGIASPLGNPTLALHNAQGTVVATNDDWKSTQEAAIEATGLAPTNDLESAILVKLAPGAYTALVSGVNGGSGVALVEVYDLHK